MLDTCICPSSAEEAPTEGWRRYYLTGEARTTRHEAHYPDCPLRLTMEERLTSTKRPSTMDL